MPIPVKKLLKKESKIKPAYKGMRFTPEDMDLDYSIHNSEIVKNEIAYRRGYHQGFYQCMIAFDNGHHRGMIGELLYKIQEWRYKKQDYLVFPPELEKRESAK